MHSATLYTRYAAILALSSYALGHSSKHAGQLRQPAGTRSYNIPITSIGASKLGVDNTTNNPEGSIAAISGISGELDILHTVPVLIGGQRFHLNIDTGSSDLWVASEECTEAACNNATVARYAESSTSSMTHVHINMKYGDSHSGTYAAGIIGLDSVGVIGGPTLPQQTFSIVRHTTNLLVQYDTSGIIGLGFPTGSHIQEMMEMSQHSEGIHHTDEFILSTPYSGPFVSRLAMHGLIEEPMFGISLDRDTTQVGGHGTLSLGALPDGVDDQSLIWVPVRMYSAEEGGMPAPTFAPNQSYPYRWEVEIDGVFLDGERLPDSTISSKEGSNRKPSALIDSGNSLLRGPYDVVDTIMRKVSPDYIPDTSNVVVPCSVPRELAFQIGGKMFPVDPHDFMSQLDLSDAVRCHIDNIVPADPPSHGSLFQWSFGTPFFRSNFVVFHYGNLTHPWVDPPRIGFKSKVPADAGNILIDAVEKAQSRTRNHLGSNPSPPRSIPSISHLGWTPQNDINSTTVEKQQLLYFKPEDIYLPSYNLCS